MLLDWYREKWEQVNDFAPDTAAEERMWKQLNAKIAHQTPSNVHWKQWLRIAAGILLPILCVGIGYLYADHFQPSASHRQAQVHVDVGQKADLYLPDGTRVFLNSASRLIYDNHSFSHSERRVRLEGEAYFEVYPNKHRTFVVQAGDVSVEALGTRFNVKAYPADDCVTTTLLAGSVRVSDASQSALLAPNDQLVFNKTKRLFGFNQVSNAEHSTAWTRNQLAFEEERLEDIAKELERMYGIRIYFEADALKDLRFSGNIKNYALDSVLQLIAFTSPIRYSREGDSTIVIRERTTPKQ
jgi:ferric-dicitrate binding protein FerR (iron transport regulator)